MRLLTSPLLWTLRAAGHGAAKGVRTFKRWRRSSSARHLFRGLPALLLLMFAAYIVLWTRLHSHGALHNRYSDWARTSVRAQEFEKAGLCFERLYQMGDRSSETVFEFARVLRRLDSNDPRIDALLDQVAPRDRAVYVPAHIWRAERVLHQSSLTNDDWAFAEAQLIQALYLDPNLPQAHILMSRLLLVTNRWAEAKAHLHEAARVKPELRLSLAKALAYSGEAAAAAEQCRLSEQWFLERLRRDPNDSESRIHLAATLTFVERFQEAITILQQGQNLSDRPEFRKAMAQIYLTWSDFLGRQQTVDIGRQLELLEDGLLCDPDNIAFFDRLMTLLNQTNDEKLAVRRHLADLLAGGRASGVIHLVLGTDAGLRRETDVAIRHLEMAAEYESTMVVAANNLACALANSDPPQLERAFLLASALVENWPNDPSIRDTRGQVLAKLGRHEDAVKDLAFAVQQMPEEGDTHRTLAEVYRHLGMDEMAKAHKRAEERVQSKKKSKSSSKNE